MKQESWNTPAFCIVSAVLLWSVPFYIEYFVLHKYALNKYIISVNLTTEHSMYCKSHGSVLLCQLTALQYVRNLFLPLLLLQSRISHTTPPSWWVSPVLERCYCEPFGPRSHPKWGKVVTASHCLFTILGKNLPLRKLWRSTPACRKHLISPVN